MSTEHVFPYRWRLEDGYPAQGIEAHGLTVFGTFICGGGSSMGYKLAGYNHLGGVEIDPKVAAIYKENHHPKHLYVEDLREFNRREDLPEELYHLDLLDGSPPCSTFSMAGDREKAWGKEKVFAEGQSLQTLDDLVFVYCETIKKLRPKVFLLENVKGLSLGNAKSYLRRIFKTVDEAGYDAQIFVLNAASMGVPQIRERCFVIGRRKELGVEEPEAVVQREAGLFRADPGQDGHQADDERVHAGGIQEIEAGGPDPFAHQYEGIWEKHRIHAALGECVEGVPDAHHGQHLSAGVPPGTESKGAVPDCDVSAGLQGAERDEAPLVDGDERAAGHDCADSAPDISAVVPMKQFLIVATAEELELPYAKVVKSSPACITIVTGVGATNVIRALKGLPTDAEVINVGYCGSASYPVGQYVFVSECRLYHPNVEFHERTYRINESGNVLCLTAGDFVTSPEHVPDGAVVDMELAYIAAFGFRKLTAIKYVSDKLDLKQYEHNSRTSSLVFPSVPEPSRQAEGTP